MTDRQKEIQRPVRDPSLITDLWTHLFSTDYLYFIPAIGVSLLWHLLPIPEAGTVGLFIWSLPLYTAGAATALQEGSASLFHLIRSRCPMQGIFILGYAFAAIVGFFIVLLLAGSLGWIGTARGEILTALLMGAAAIVPMVRIWPDYLLRVIHPRYGMGERWLGVGFESYGLGPTFLTAWKYSAQAKLPASTVASALVSLFVVVGGVVFLHSDLFPSHKDFRFAGGIVIIGLFYPAAHLVLVRAGFRLLNANGILPKPGPEKGFQPSISPSPTPEASSRLQVFDRKALIDERAYDLFDNEQIITGWCYSRENGRTWNTVVGYEEENDQVVFVNGPYNTGHWGHEAEGKEAFDPDDFLTGWFQHRYPVPENAAEQIDRFLRTNRNQSIDTTTSPER